MPAVYNFNVHRRGDTFTGVDFVMDEEGIPMDLTGAVVKVHVRPKADLTVLAFAWLTADSSILIAGEDNNIIRLQPLSADFMDDIDAGIYLFDLEVTFPSGEKITYITGTFIIEDDITK